MWGWAVRRRCFPSAGTAPGPAVLLLVDFPPLNSLLSMFVSSVVSRGCAGIGLATSCQGCALASRGVLVCSPRCKPLPSFSSRLSACARQARYGENSFLRKLSMVFCVQMPGHCHHISTVFKPSPPGTAGREGQYMGSTSVHFRTWQPGAEESSVDGVRGGGSCRTVCLLRGLFDSGGRRHTRALVLWEKDGSDFTICHLPTCPAGSRHPFNG